MPQEQTLSHHLTTQVQIAILESYFLANRLVELERQRLRPVQQLQLLGENLDSARSQIRVGGAGGTFPNLARDPDHELAAQPLGLLEDFGRIRVEHDLQQPFPVAQIDENDPSVVPAAMYPSRDRDFLAGQLLVDVSAVM